MVAYRTEMAVYERLREIRAGMLGQIRRVLDRAVRGNATVEQAIRAVKVWLDPAQAKRVLPSAPAQPKPPVMGLTPGAAASGARRIMLTETTAVHAKAKSNTARERGFLLKWELGSSHKNADTCDDHAFRDDGLGPGVYRPGTEPQCPSHPNCRCSLAMIAPSEEQLWAMGREPWRDAA